MLQDDENKKIYLKKIFKKKQWIVQHIAFNRTPVLYMLKMDFVVNAVLLLDLYDNHVAGVVMI